MVIFSVASDVLESRLSLDCGHGRRGQHTKDEELLGWKRGGLSLAGLL